MDGGLESSKLKGKLLCNLKKTLYRQVDTRIMPSDFIVEQLNFERGQKPLLYSGKYRTYNK